MTISFRAVRGLRQQPLLVCVSSPAFNNASASGFSRKAAANIRRIIELWEEREAPYTAVRADARGAEIDCQARPKVFAAGELVFDSVRCSILRNHKFRNFHDDIGAPPIIMIGSGLESTILASAIDAYWFDIPFTIIRDAVFPARNLKEAECGTALKIIANFVDVVDMEFIEND
jgi:hypothetical protein